MDDVEATNVFLTMYDYTGPTHVTTTSDNDGITGIELDVVRNLVLVDVEFDGVVGLDAGVGVAESPTIVGDDVGDALGTDSQFSDLEKLIARFLRCDAVDGETALNIIKEAEVFARLFDGDDI